MDPAYTLLLTNLQTSSPRLPLPAIQGSLAHHLAHQPTPTPLAASALSSPLFSGAPLSLPRLRLLATAFRHAASLRDARNTVDVGWTRAVLRGVRGTRPLPRLAACGGLLAGLHDVKAPTGSVTRIEDEVVIAVAEVVDAAGAWEREFQPKTEHTDVDALSLALILAAESLSLVPSEKFHALPLPTLARLLTSTIDTAFHSGSFLAALSDSAIHLPSGQLSIPTASPLVSSLAGLTSSLLLTSVAPLTRLAARTLSLLGDLSAISQALGLFATIAARVEVDWEGAPLKDAVDENQIAPDTRETSTAIWTLLKTLLFATIMVVESTLSSLVFLPPTSSPPTSATIARTALLALSHLSFVVSQFGGITSEAFPELRRTFFLAHDILAADGAGGAGEMWVKDVSISCREMSQAKQAFALASIEQLVPVLSVQTIESSVLPLCLTHLWDVTRRPTYESAHSVMLAIFAANAGKVSGSTFPAQLVPFYSGCLVENSADGRLSTAQLRLAFAALVRGAGGDGNGHLAWSCIDTLLSAARTLPPSAYEHRHRLHLALISSISALPLSLLPRVLDAVRSVIIGEQDSEKRREMVEDVFKEVLEKVGDREKEFVVKWWYEYREELAGNVEKGDSAMISRL